ncbi:MAG: SBBP repeat-containing protein [Planctomycetota bacterium]|jgi:outer membrane protein assembly factor BamB
MKDRVFAAMIPGWVMLVIAGASCASTNSWSHYREFGWDIAIDLSGNVYFASGGCYDINSQPQFVTSKYDKEGRKLWQHRYEGAVKGFGVCEALVVDHAGNVYVTGGVVTRETEEEKRLDETVFGYATVRYDPAGNRQWDACYQKPRKMLSWPVYMAVDSKSNVYITGTSREPAFNGQIGEDTEDLYRLEYPDSNFVTIKYDQQGRQLWAIEFGSPGNHENSASAIAADRAGNVYVTGGSVKHKGIAGSDFHIATIKYDTNGKEVWVTQHRGEPNSISIAEDLALDSSGNVYVIGSSRDQESSDLLTIKYDTDGKEQWVARYRLPGENLVVATAVAMEQAGRLWVTACVTDSRAGRASHDSGGDRSTKGRVVTIEYDATGKQCWNSTYNGPQANALWPYHLIADIQGNVYILSSLRKTWYDSDMLVIQYDTSGKEKKAEEFTSPSDLAKFLGTAVTLARDSSRSTR